MKEQQDISRNLLENSESLFQGLLESAPDAILIVGREGRIVLANSQTEVMFGYTREELLGQTIELLMPERFRHSHVAHREGYISDPRTRPMGTGLSLAGRRRDGSEFPVEISLSPRETADGLLVTAIIRDITKRKQVEEELRKAHDELEVKVEERTAELREANQALQSEIAEHRRAQERLREQAALLNHAQDAIMVRDLAGRILFWNRRAERIYGWTAEEAMGKDIRDLLYAKGSSQYEQAYREVIERGEWMGELRQTTREGKEIVVEGRWTVVKNDSEGPSSILAINTDITDRKKLEAQFLRAQRMESIGTLAGGIAHDINNVLAPILMSVQMLQRKIDDESSLRMLSMLQKNAERGANMVRQLLEFARGVEGERMILQPRHLIKEIIKILRETLPKSIEVEFLLPEDLWPITGDATQVHQVLMNLCVNARDAMPHGGTITIRAENARIDQNYAEMNLDAKAGQYVAITVLDNGIGIPAHIIDKVFEPFFTTKEQGKGTGLGLSTVLAIIKSHGGFVNVYSEQGRGTQFRVYLPAADSPYLSHTREAAPELPLGHGEMVLVVDDEEAIREITRGTLESFGYKVMTAGDGTEAVALYAQNRDDVKLVLTDMVMPFMDGPSTIRALKKINPQIKIIASSGLTESGKANELLKLGVHTFLQKPYTAEKLLTAIAELIRPNQS